MLDLKRHKKTLISVARTAITVSMHKAMDNCRHFCPKKGPEEPDYIAALVLEGTKILEKGWSVILSKYHIPLSITGIYCHQSPMLHYNGMRGNYCEIGDLLWCHFHKKQNGEYDRNAILLQAKRVPQLPYRLPSSEMDQFNLYSIWPQFKYTKPVKLKDKIRHVTPSSLRRGAQYLTIEDNSPGIYGLPRTYPCHICSSYDPLIYHTDLGLGLTNLLDFTEGDMFDSNIVSSSKKDWSKVIWDLIKITAETPMTRKRSGYKNCPRIAGHRPAQLQGCISISQVNPPNIFLDFFSKSDYDSLIDFYNNKDPNKSNNNNYYDENGGISTIIIETGETEE